MNIDQLREQDDIRLQEEAWDTESPNCAPGLFKIKTPGTKWEMADMTLYERPVEFKVGDLIGGRSGVYKIEGISHGSLHATAVAFAFTGHSTSRTAIGDSFSFSLKRLQGFHLWERADNRATPHKQNKEVDYDRDNPKEDYSDAFDILKSMLGG